MSANFRPALGVALLAVGAVLPLGAVFVFETDWPPVLKSALTGALLFGPELATIPAAAIMGKENFARIVAGLKRSIRSIKPAGNIGPVRHAIGLVLFLVPILPAYVMAYLPSWMPDDSAERLWVNLFPCEPVRVGRGFLGQTEITLRKRGPRNLPRPPRRPFDAA